MTEAVTALPYKIPKRRHPAINFVLTQPLGAAGLFVIILMMIGGLFAEFVSPYDPLTLDYGSMLAAPSADHWFGTDAFGRDVLSRIIHGARTALMVGFLSSFFGSTIGAIIGIVSAYFGGRTDMIIQQIMDVILSFPIIVLALAMVAILGKGNIGGIDVNLIIAIAIPMVPRVARVVRSSALAIREMAYI
ncbi:MAG: ABC transporter permease, partial [Alphaproteobacteria bacterium]|nr:ABC transporter permease [Alphaproteobacteria bacterium]